MATMDRKMIEEEVSLTPSEQKTLDTMLNQYDEIHALHESYKTQRDVLNNAIKQKYADFGIRRYTNGQGVTVSVSESTKRVVDDDKLIAYLKTLGIDTSSIIKTREYVDQEALADAIYRGTIDAKAVTEFVTEKVTKSLRITRKEILTE